MQYWIATPVALLSVLSLYVNRSEVQKLLKPAIIIGLLAGISRLLFSIASQDVDPIRSFVEYTLLCWLAAWGGLSMAKRFSLPGLFIPDSINKQIIYTGLVALGVIALNTLMIIQTTKMSVIPPWFQRLQSVPYVITMSLQAGLVEETIFRLLSIPLLFWLLEIVGWKSKALLFRKLVIVILSAILFGSIHGAGFMGAFLFGIAFGYSFLSFGWLPCVAIHFLGDLVPYLFVFQYLKT
jgi:hypothetical protein